MVGLRGNLLEMNEVHVDSGPPPRSYATFADAIFGAEHHPVQGRAAAASRLLVHAQVTGGWWSTAACAIRFSNDRLLRVDACNFELDWRVEPSSDSAPQAPYAPVKLVWKAELSRVFDPLSLLARISGAEFIRLFVNEMGLLLYTRGNPVLWFHAVRKRGSGDEFLIALLTWRTPCPAPASFQRSKRRLNSSPSVPPVILQHARRVAFTEWNCAAWIGPFSLWWSTKHDHGSSATKIGFPLVASSWTVPCSCAASLTSGTAARSYTLGKEPQGSH